MIKKKAKPRWATTHPKGYLIRLSFNMLGAMVDITQGYQGDDSPRWRDQTMEALRNRRYIIGSGARTGLTPTGRSILPGALEVMQPWQRTPKKQATRAA